MMTPFMPVTLSTSPSISDEDAAFFAALVASRIGVQLHGRGYLIRSRLMPVVQQFGLDSVNGLIASIRAGNSSVEAAAVEAMTTNETSFFRDKHPFANLAEFVLPELVRRGGRRLTIWNGACSSGQESYTLAMIVAERFPDLARSGRARIISTDVSPKMVARTKAGTYSNFETNRGLPPGRTAAHFDQTHDGWSAKPHLRSLIDARELNLLTPWRGIPTCDVVMLRNVLIYFSLDAKREVLRRIRTEVLAPDGCIVVGSSESLFGFDPNLEARRLGGSTFHFIKNQSET